MGEELPRERNIWFPHVRCSVQSNEDWFPQNPPKKTNKILVAIDIIDEFIVVGLIIYGIYWLVKRFLL